MKTNLIRSLLFVLGGSLATVALAGNVTVSLGQVPAVGNVNELLRKVNTHSTTINTLVAKIRGLVDAAKKQKDVVKLNCLNDKLKRAHAIVTLAQQGLAEVESAKASGDEAGLRHQATRFGILEEQVKVLTTEAELCIGEDVGYVGPTKTNVLIDANIPDEDPTLWQIPPLEPPTRFTEASATS